MKESNEDWIGLSDRFVMHTYGRSAITIIEGKGCYLKDAQGKTYTDFVAGIAVCSLGHAHPEIAEAVCRQVKTLVHVSNLYCTIPQAELARILVENSFADKVFFCNSGAEANEAAIKLARKYSQDHFGPDRYEILSLSGSFHGRTLAALSATGQTKFHKGFEPLVQGFRYVTAGDLSSMEKAITPGTCALLMEPVQGEGGVIPFDPGYIKEIRQLCSEKDLLLIFDEVQVGMGRTGKLFAYEHYGVEPDIMTLAKALANGLPLGALLASDKVAQSFTPGTHASTFGGNPVNCSASLVVMQNLLQKGVLANCTEMGLYFKEKLESLRRKYPLLVKEVRGLGLILGMELNIEGIDLVNGLLEDGFLINCTQGRVLRFTPPLIITRTEIDSLIQSLDRQLSSKVI